MSHVGGDLPRLHTEIAVAMIVAKGTETFKIQRDTIEPPHGKTNILHRRKQSANLIIAFVFATRIVQFLFYLNLKFQASSSFLCLYRLVSVGPLRKPHCWSPTRWLNYKHSQHCFRRVSPMPIRYEESQNSVNRNSTNRTPCGCNKHEAKYHP